jgi:hypothetical protein
LNKVDITRFKKELIAVIVEVGLDTGLNALASFNAGTSLYITQPTFGQFIKYLYRQIND